MRVTAVLPFASLVAASFALPFFAPRTASACGGCFAPPSDNTLVTDHRMVLSISTKETTLYDQIRYSGNPSSFAWVLPIHGEADVGVSADLVFQTIDQQTQTSIQPPPQNCPAPPVCRSAYDSPSASAGGGYDASARSSADAAAGPPAVQVLKEETVGPYETVQLAATNAAALHDWLTDHGYAIPADLEPMLAGYVKEGFGFLALKLVPGSGVQSMKPVRITTKGASPALPLRMVAAGSGVGVGLTLWVVGEGRWEPQTFPSFTVTQSDLTWTWATYRSNYEELRTAAFGRLGASAWELESSIDFSSSIVSSRIDQFVNSPMPAQVQLPDGGVGRFRIYDPVVGPGGTIEKTEAQLAADDLAALFQGRAVSRVTRLKSELPRASLSTDLALQASTDQSVLPNFRVISRETDEPMCPVYNDDCSYAGQKPRSEARAKAVDSCGGAGAGKHFCPQSGNAASGPVGTSASGCTAAAGRDGRDGLPLATLALMSLFGVARSRRKARAPR
ncbi:MAG: DUF2330 domain-containing protein [Myxococcales bacterium]|nr:DUF2330 domain-containing protein [Myxococcales bacterium]